MKTLTKVIYSVLDKLDFNLHFGGKFKNYIALNLKKRLRKRFAIVLNNYYALIEVNFEPHLFELVLFNRTLVLYEN